MSDNELRVGDLAGRAGVTVRTLHHWEEVGLLSPAGRSPAGHRLYGSRQLEQVQRIRSLKALGMPLDEIRTTLASDGPSLGEILHTHRLRLRDQIRVLQGLEARLESLLTVLDRDGAVEDEDLLRVMELMTAVERHFTPGQIQTLRARERALGPEAIRSAQEEWPRLTASLREAMERDLDPRTPTVQTLAKRWKELIEAFSGGDKAVERSLGDMYREEPRLAEGQGLSPQLMAYLKKAMESGP